MSEYQIDRPLFMIGMPRSGTSFLSEVFSNHKDLGWFSNYFVRAPMSPYIAFFDRLAFLPKVGVHLKGKKKQEKTILSKILNYFPYPSEAWPIWKILFGEKFLTDYLIDTVATDKEKQKAKKLIASVLKYQGKKRFLSKFTGPPRIKYLKSIFPDAYFIHIIRDPRAVVASLMNVKFWKAGGGLDEPWWQNGFPDDYRKKWEDGGRSPVALAALQWKRIINLTMEESEFLSKERFIEIKYEDLIVNQNELLEFISKKCKLTEDFNANKSLGNKSIIKNMNYKFKQVLTLEEIKLIEEITKETAYKAGYYYDTTICI